MYVSKCVFALWSKQRMTVSLHHKKRFEIKILPGVVSTCYILIENSRINQASVRTQLVGVVSANAKRSA